jgi:hypothetical protein
MPVSLATWESLELLQQCFLGAPAWGQADFLPREEGGDVTNSLMLGDETESKGSS